MNSVHPESYSSTRPPAVSTDLTDLDPRDQAVQPTITPKLTKSQKKRRRRWLKLRAQAQAQLPNPQHTQNAERSSSIMPSPAASVDQPGTIEAVDKGAQDVQEPQLSKSQKRRRRRAMKRYREQHEHRAASSSIQPGESSSLMTILDHSDPRPSMDVPADMPMRGVVESRNNEIGSKAAHTSLATLPVEIQLQILEACLVTSSPHIQLTVRNEKGYNLRPHPEADKAVALNILRVCRLYWEEGARMFWSKNKFLLRASTVDLARPVLVDYYASGLPWMKHLMINYQILFCRHCDLNAAVDICKLVQKTPSLQTLEIEFVHDDEWLCSGWNCAHERSGSEEAEPFRSAYWAARAATGEPKHKIQVLKITEASGRSTTILEVRTEKMVYSIGYFADRSTCGTF